MVEYMKQVEKSTIVFMMFLVTILNNVNQAASEKRDREK